MSRAVRLMSLIAAISFWSAIGATARAEESDTAALAAALKTAKATLQASPDPSATLSSSADFPGLPVIRPTLLRRFRAGTRRASPVAQHVLVTVPSLPPRRGEQPSRSVFGCSCCLRPSEVGSALGATFFEATMRSLLIQPGDS